MLTRQKSNVGLGGFWWLESKRVIHFVGLNESQMGTHSMSIIGS